MKGKVKITLTPIIALVILTASIYFVLDDNIKIVVGNTNTEFYVWENEKWVLGATEYVQLWDGTTRMRAKSRNVEYTIDGDITKIIRTSLWKDNITTIDTYTFDSSVSDIELVPIEHTVRCINCNGKIIHFEYRDIEYDGITRKAISPESFGHNMKIEWQSEDLMWAKLYQQKIASDKLIIRYRAYSDDETYYVRMFDPVAISFIDPTPANNNDTSNTYAYINTSVSDGTDSTALFDWNYSLVGWWRFNDNSTHDNSSYENNGTQEGGVNCSATGKFGGACSFDGVSDYVNISDATELQFNSITEDFSICAWIYALNNPTVYDLIIDKRDADNDGYRFTTQTNGRIELSLNSTDAYSANSAITPSTWHHVCGVVDRSANIILYVDGTASGTPVSAQEIIMSTTNDLVIGRQSYSAGSYFNGTIDEITIHNRALSEQEIKASYDVGTYRLYNNFTDLVDGDYDYIAYVQNSSGNIEQTETRTINIHYENITQCSTLEKNYRTYYLREDITDSSTSNCIDITANHVTFECQSYTIDGDDSADTGIRVSRASITTTNVTIKNCILTDWDRYGISLSRASYNDIINVSVSSCPDIGIDLFFSNHNEINESTINNNNEGINIGGSDYNKIHNVTVDSSVATGISIEYGADYNNITFSTISNTTIYGLTFWNDGSPGLTDSYIYNNLLNNTVNYIDDYTPTTSYFNTDTQIGTRIYTSGSYIGGNYWTNPNSTGYSNDCIDYDDDGFCDVAYTVSEGVIDNLPLTSSSISDFNITTTSGTENLFYAYQPIQTEIEPYGQTSTIGRYTLDNNNTYVIDIYAKLNETDPSPIICYQETATTATSCGGLATGAYSSSNNWNDGLWSTFTVTTGIYYANYTRPDNTVNNGYWDIGYSTTAGALTRANKSILYGCWQDDDTIQLRVNSSDEGNGQTTWQCYNYLTSFWDTIYNTGASYWNYRIIYEEAIWWVIESEQKPLTIKLDEEYDYDNSVSINTSYQLIYDDFEVDGTGYLWIWADFNNLQSQWDPKLDIVGVGS